MAWKLFSWQNYLENFMQILSPSLEISLRVLSLFSYSTCPFSKIYFFCINTSFFVIHCFQPDQVLVKKMCTTKYQNLFSKSYPHKKKRIGIITQMMYKNEFSKNPSFCAIAKLSCSSENSFRQQIKQYNYLHFQSDKVDIFFLQALNP